MATDLIRLPWWLIRLGKYLTQKSDGGKIREYTNTDLRIQWIPYSAYDEKVNVMVASNELPKLIKLNYTPTTISSLEADLFWDITDQ